LKIQEQKDVPGSIIIIQKIRYNCIIIPPGKNKTIDRIIIIKTTTITTFTQVLKKPLLFISIYKLNN